MKKTGNTKLESSVVVKQILITQILSIIFAIVGEIHIRLIIAHDFLFTNIMLLNLVIISLTILYTIAIRFSLKGSWKNVLLISIPYVVYGFVVLWYGSEIFPVETDSNDYGVGIMGILVSMYQWISVIVASVIGTCLSKIRLKKEI
ncbi:hypothetical protein [Clostridium sp. DL1XJH146]